MVIQPGKFIVAVISRRNGLARSNVVWHLMLCQMMSVKSHYSRKRGFRQGKGEVPRANKMGTSCEVPGKTHENDGVIIRILVKRRCRKCRVTSSMQPLRVGARVPLRCPAPCPLPAGCGCGHLRCRNVM